MSAFYPTCLRDRTLALTPLPTPAAAVRIAPGSFNKGTFIKLNRDGPGKGEE